MHSHMPWSSKEDPGQPEEESLMSILATPQLRYELTLLITSCMESMRKCILDVFDPQISGKPCSHTAADALRNLDVDPKEIEEEQQKEAEKRLKEINRNDMQELKTAALKFFDEWRDSVLERVGDVMNSNSETVKEKEHGKTTSSPIPDKKDTLGKQEKNVYAPMGEFYHALDTPLAELEEEKRALILHSMVLLLLSLEHYAAHSRALLLYLTSSLRLSVKTLTGDEEKVAKGLLEVAKQINADEETKRAAEANATARKWKVGLASVAGAAIVGVTGGLAAPLLAAGVGTVMGGLGLGATATAGYLGTLAGSSIVVGALFGAYGGRMTGKMMDDYAREVSDFAFVPIRKHHKPLTAEKDYRRLRIAIGISGWLTEKKEVVEPWYVFGQSFESFALRWELEALLNLGNSLMSFVKSQAWGYAKKEIIRRTVFAALTEALWPLALIKIGKIIDNPFSLAKSRADRAGRVLADALINKVQGERPVTLAGYSHGARVIYTCLQTLAERKAFGLVEHVILAGTPASSDSEDWRKIRAVVVGRVVNVYSENDYILAFLYRTSSIKLSVAGLNEVTGVGGIQNVDVSELVSGHMRYRYLIGSILKKVGFEDVDVSEVEREEEILMAVEEEEEKEAIGKKSEKDVEQEVKDMEKEVERKNEESMMNWAERLHLDDITSRFSGTEKKKDVT